MRRKEREITDFSMLLKIVKSFSIGHLAMNDNGTPYGVTMNFFAEATEGGITLFFHGAQSGRKAEILARNPAVYFFAERDDGARETTGFDGACSMTEYYVSVAGEGDMVRLNDAAEKKRVLLAMANQCAKIPSESLPDAVICKTNVWKLTLRNLTGKSNPPLKTEDA